jgi:predicted  nucleic acid-binding Zn-ribbon protein
MDELTPFAFWCQKVMPAVLDDSLSFYEVLCKLTAKLNDAIETINGHSELIKTMQSEIDALQTLTAQHTQQIADLTKKVQANANNITAINTRTKGLSTKTDSANNWFGLNLQTDDSYVYRLAWSTDAPAASVLQTSRPGSVYYQIGGPQDDWTWAHVQNSTKGTQPAFTSISRTIYNQITNDINNVESSAAQNAQAIKALQDLASDHSTAISSLQDSVGKNTQAITDLNNGLSNTNATVAKIESSLETLDTRTKGISTNVSGDGAWYGITLNTDTGLNYRIAWCNNATDDMLSTSSRGSVYLFNQGISALTGAMGWSQTATNNVEAWYKGLSNGTVTNINNKINTLENKTKGFSTVNDTVSGWFGFNLLVGSDNYRIGWSPSAPIEAVTEASAPGSLYLTQTGLTGNTYGYSQTGKQEVKTLYNGSDTSSIENEIKTLQTNLASATNTITQVGNLANEINTRTKGISTKTDSSDNWFGISLSTDDSYIYRVAWSNETPALPVLRQSRPGSLYLRIGGPAPDIWLYAWDQDGTDTAMPLVTEKI